MSRYDGNISGRDEPLDLSKETPLVQAIAVMYGLGAVTDEARFLREDRADGRELSESEARLVATVDRMLEIGLTAFLNENAVEGDGE